MDLDLLEKNLELLLLHIASILAAAIDVAVNPDAQWRDGVHAWFGVGRTKR